MKIRIAFVLIASLALVACEPAGDEPLVGTLERDRIVLPAERAEPVVERFVEEGAHVEAGEKILQLDTGRAQAEYDRLASTLEQARRRVDELVRGPRKENIREARARLAAVEAELANARSEAERISALAADNLASTAERDAANAARDRAAAERDAARAALDTLLEGTTIEELDQVRATAEAAEAALRAQEILLQRLTIRAPRAARIEALPFEKGSQPPAGATIAVLLADGAPTVRTHVPIARRAAFARGADVTVHVPGHGNYKGTVRHVSADADFTPYFALTEHDRGRLSHAAEILLDARAAELPAGLPVDVYADADE